jgi:hypothetical protein
MKPRFVAELTRDDLAALLKQKPVVPTFPERTPG